MARVGRDKLQIMYTLWRWRTQLVISILLLCSTTITTCLSFAPPDVAATQARTTTSAKLSSSSLRSSSRHVLKWKRPSCCERRHARFQSTLFVFTNSYGRGAEIWPECNENPINLSESFPGGKIPDAAQKILQQQLQSSTASTGSDASIFQKVVKHATTAERLTAAIAVAVLIGGFVPLVDILLATGWSTYLWLLHRLARTPRQQEQGKESSVKVPTLPSLPPQGHVPWFVSNPLGHSLSKSKIYQQWLDTGVILGLLGPVLLLSRYTIWAAPQHKHLEAAAACARPLFWLCCQALTEAVARNVLMPLPIRILIPVSYNALRLGPLWAWATAPFALNVVGRLLAISNWVYVTTNLLAFLLPVASLRYLRAHFLAVEAKEVHLRETLDEVLL